MSVEHFRTSGLDAHDVEQFITDMDADFLPRLSERVDIPTYAAKLVSKAEMYTCVESGQLLGLIAFYCDPSEAGSIAYITFLGVSRTARRRGLAEKLLRRCVEHAGQAGVSSIGVETWHTNTPVLNLYKAHGFKVTGEVADRGNGLRSVKMARRLQEGEEQFT